MRILYTIFIVFSTLIPFIGSAQPIIINADAKRGCDQLNVNFTFSSTIATASVFWDFGNGITSTDLVPTTVTYAPGAYDVKLVINGTDSVTYSDFILVGDTPEAVISPRDTSSGDYLLVNLQANVNNLSSILFTPLFYYWDIDGTFAGTSQVAWHLFPTTGQYMAQVIVTDTIGCSDTTTLQLSVNERIIVPNVFSPNNDTRNDYFEISANDRFFMNFQVFTRTGLLVYKTKAKTIRWDGKMQSGIEVPEGIYFYIIDTEGPGQNISQKGFFYLYR